MQTTHDLGNTPEGPDFEMSRKFILPLGAATTVTPARQHLRRGYHRYPSVNNLTVLQRDRRLRLVASTIQNGRSAF